MVDFIVTGGFRHARLGTAGGHAGGGPLPAPKTLSADTSLPSGFRSLSA
jgi:hypothetical protein